MKKGIQIRNITPLDKNALVELYDDVWPETAGTKKGKTEWMLSSMVFYGVCACVDNKIIGSRPSFYSNMYFQDRKLNAVQCGNSCVHNDFRRYGIFSKMNAVFIDKFFIEDKNDLVFNVSVYASKMAYQKLGWIYIDTLAKLTYIVQWGSLLWKTKLNIKNLEGRVSYQNNDIPSLIDFDNKLLEIRENYFRRTNNIHTNYDMDFFRWRLNSDSNITLFSIEKLGVIIYKIGNKNGLKVITIGEILLYEYNRKNIKIAIKSLQKAYSPDIFEIAITEQHPCYPFYRKAGFIINPFKKYLNLGVKVVSDEMKQVCLRPDNWALVSIDIDTF
jgi:hypothetical protein